MVAITAEIKGGGIHGGGAGKHVNTINTIKYFHFPFSLMNGARSE